MDQRDSQDQRYERTIAAYGPALGRLARGYEADSERRRDLLQDILVALWRSLAAYDGRCSLRTWAYRVAHNVAATHVLKARRGRGLVSLDEVQLIDGDDPEGAVHTSHALARLMRLVQALKPADRQVMLLYLEDTDAAGIAEITGLSPGAVAVRIHRIKALLAQRFHQTGEP